MRDFANLMFRRPTKESVHIHSPSFGHRQTGARTIKTHGQDEIFSISFIQDGKYIIGCSAEGKICRWRTDDAREVGVSEMNKGRRVLTISISSDGKWLVSGSESGRLTVWDLKTKAKVIEWDGHIKGVCALDISPDSTRFASGSNDMTTCVWCIFTGNQLSGPLEHDGIPIGLKYSPDGRFIAATTCNGRSVRILDSQGGRNLVCIPVEVAFSKNQSLAWSKDGEKIFAISRNDYISCLDVSGKAVTCLQIHTGNDLRCISMAPNGTFIAVSVNSSVSFWDTTTFKQVGLVLELDHSRAQSMTISRNYHLAISADTGITIYNLFDVLPSQYVDEKDAEIWRLKREVAYRDEIVECSLAVIRVYKQTLRCQALYDEGLILEAANLLLLIRRFASEAVNADAQLMDWIAGLTQRCVMTLEKTGDSAASEADTYDEAVSAYSTALSLSLSIPNSLLVKWVVMMLQRCSPGEVLDASVQFEVPSFVIYKTICESLEENGLIKRAAECFLIMMNEPPGNAGTGDTRDERWTHTFRCRCAEKLEILADSAMALENHGSAIELYSCALSLGPLNSRDILLKRSEARVPAGFLEGALDDANKAIELDPSCFRGYKSLHAALYAMRRYSEAVKAFKSMLLRLEQSPEDNIRRLRQEYVDAGPTIRKIINEIVPCMPPVLINTATGHLCDKAKQVEAFEALPVCHELVSSMTTKHTLDHARIREEVEKYYRYVMLSHRWDGDEPLFQHVKNTSIYDLKVSLENKKLKSFSQIASSFDFQWAWSDTCCIDRTDNKVLTKAILKMFDWYHHASLTVVYLLGVLSSSQKPGDLQRSIWNSRAWTFQEYVASRTIRFYTEDWKPYLGLDIFNHKASPVILAEMERGMHISRIRPGFDRVREKLQLISMREMTHKEDAAYSLYSVFKASIPVMYGEGNRAVGRLLEHVLEGSRDVTVLAWTGIPGDYNSCLPNDLTVYHRLASSHVPTPLRNGEMTRKVESLRSSLPDLSSIVSLYNRLRVVPGPSMSSSRLKLSCIVFPLTGLVPVMQASGGDTYQVATSALGTVGITTTDRLSLRRGLVLVHPWIPCLLDQEYSRSGESLDETTKALRFYCRLTQRFGALLLVRVSRVGYKRVAADSLIIVQVRKDVPLTDVQCNMSISEIEIE